MSGRLRFLPQVGFAALALILSGAAFAQAPPKLEPLPDIPPPPPSLSGSKNDPEPTISIKQDGQNKIEEYRINGKLYAVRVTPPVGKPYVMTDPDGKGVMIRSDDIGGNHPSPPRWVIFEF